MPRPMKPLLLPLAAALLPLLLGPAACTGYQAGAPRPAALAGIQRIAVPMFANDTQHPRAEAIATSAVANALLQEGAFRLASRDSADAVLEGKVSSIRYSPLRGTRLNPQLAEEFYNTITLTWTLRDAKNPTRILAAGTSEGTSQLFRDPNLQTARNNALDDALERAADALVSRISHGY